MANLYQTALIDQLNPSGKRTTAPGFQAPVDPQTTPIEGPPPVAAPKPFVSALNGYEPTKLTAEHAKKSPKYAFGMLAREFEDTPDGLLAMSKDPRFAAAGFQYVGKDKILAPDPDRGGALGTVDVGLGFSDGGRRGWQWGAEGPGAAAAPAAGGMGLARPTPFQPSLAGGGLDQTFGAGVQQTLSQYAQQSPFLAALLQQLGGAR